MLIKYLFPRKKTLLPPVVVEKKNKKKKSPSHSSSSSSKKNAATWPLIHKSFFKTYDNTGHCRPLCRKNTGSTMSFDTKLSRKEPPKGDYLFVIRVSHPETIYYFPEKNAMHTAVNCETKKPRSVHHDCLGKNEPVLCAGTIIFEGDKTVTLINNSGHYLPKKESLYYTASILKKKLGYRVTNFDFF